MEGDIPVVAMPSKKGNLVSNGECETKNENKDSETYPSL